jgi:ankyrin repeat protein
MVIDKGEQDRPEAAATQRRARRLSFVNALQILAVLVFCLTIFNLSTQDQASHTDLMLSEAVETGNLQAARSAIAQGASVNQRNGVGTTPLHTAAWRGDLAMARLLIEAGAQIDVMDSQTGETPLHSAARGAEPAMLTFLLQLGADPQVRTLSDSEQCNGTIYPAGATALDIARINGLSQLDPMPDDDQQLVQ